MTSAEGEDVNSHVTLPEQDAASVSGTSVAAPPPVPKAAAWRGAGRSEFDSVITAAIRRATPLLDGIRDRELDRLALKTIAELSGLQSEPAALAARLLRDDVARLRHFRSVSQNVRKV